MNQTSSSRDNFKGNYYPAQDVLVASVYATLHRFFPDDPIVVEEGDSRDLFESTDVVSGNSCIAVRARRYGRYKNRFDTDFTIRCRVSYGGETEWHKILAGYTTHMLYALAHFDRPELGYLAYALFRTEPIRRRRMEIGLPGNYRPNKDGTGFYAVRWALFSDDEDFFVHVEPERYGVGRVVYAQWERLKNRSERVGMGNSLTDVYKTCKVCGGYNEAYGEPIACECKRLSCGCYGVCMSGHNV